MNIFLLDHDLDTCARYHCDKHVVKMTLETAQILCSALHLLGVPHNGYKPSHIHHPCVVWATRLPHFIWLRRFGRALSAEYTRRFQREHKSLQVINALPIPEMTVASPKYWALAMPPQYILYDYIDFGIGKALDFIPDYVESYRSYYRSKLGTFDMKYTNTEVPSWLIKE